MVTVFDIFLKEINVVFTVKRFGKSVLSLFLIVMHWFYYLSATWLQMGTVLKLCRTALSDFNASVHDTFNKGYTHCDLNDFSNAD